MSRPPGRLARILGLDGVILTVPLQAINVTSNFITRVSMTRGGGEVAGLATSTATVDVARELPTAPSSAQAMSVQLTAGARSRLTTLTGQDGDAYRYRFVGRNAGQEVTDSGDTKPLSTLVTCSDWLTMLPLIDPGATGTRADPSVHRLYRSAMNRANLPSPELESWGSAWHRVIIPDPPIDTIDVTTSDVFGKYGFDLGHVVRQLRDGTPQALAHDYRAVQAAQWTALYPQPLLRDQVLAPIKWTQSVTVPTRTTALIRNQTNGDIVTWTITIGDPSFVTKGETLDLSHVLVDGVLEDTLLKAVIARASRTAPDRYRLNEVTIDLLALLERGRPVDRAQVAQLLRLEHGDAIALSNDWPSAVGGLYFVPGIAEEITRESWTMTLTLAPYNLVVGAHHDPLPPGNTWDTAYPRTRIWDTPSTTWEASP